MVLPDRWSPGHGIPGDERGGGREKIGVYAFLFYALQGWPAVLLCDLG